MNNRLKTFILENLQEHVINRKAMFIPLLFVSTFGLVGYAAIDKEAPTIDANKISVLYGTDLDKTMFSIEDNRDSLANLDVTIDDSSYDANQLGTYSVEVSATDMFSNTVTKNVEVEVIDKTAPVFTTSCDGYVIEVAVNGSADITEYVTATDNVDGDVSAFIETDETLDTSKLGTQMIEVSVSDNSGNTTTETYEFTITDTIAPTITLSDDTITVDYGSSFDYSDYVTIMDNYDKEVDVNVEGSVDTKSEETQTLTITATDSSANTSTATLTVDVEDLTAPAITLSKSKVSIYTGDSFSASKYLSSATDNKDGDLTDEVKISSNVKTSTKGTYTVTYSVSDAAGNTSSKTLTVVVTTKTSGIVATAKSKLGCAYKYGSTGPNTFDCSGFTQWVYAQNGKSIPRTSSAQKSGGTVISLSQLQPGDIVWRSGHVGIYVGNGLVIHSPHTGAVVSYTSVSGFTCGVRY
ncbi:MAG: DUF5011 domain-containing protein [Erysipelotrichaceae bacterium]|nr:DUF5011 domain-containing protein [Erysipelotrichaceae bacterium]